MTRHRHLALAAAIGLAAAYAPMSAQALVKWTMDDTHCQANCGSGQPTTRTFSTEFGVANDVTVSAWAATEIGGNNDRLDQAGIGLYGGGLGVTYMDAGAGAETLTQPQHAMDNDGRYEVMLFDFGADSVTLSHVQFGWWWNDLDISVLAYTGGGAPSLDGIKYVSDVNGNEELTSNGWEVIGNYGDIQNNAGLLQSINSQNISSSYWLIGAYNPSFGGCAACGTGALDYMKLLALKGDVDEPPGGDNEVPEPGTLLLLAGALPLLRRRWWGNDDARTGSVLAA